jgi:hypothetical protein
LVVLAFYFSGAKWELIGGGAKRAQNASPILLPVSHQDEGSPIIWMREAGWTVRV